MIRSAYANFFQGIESAKIKLGSVTHLIGPNGAGKTSLAEAIQFALLGEPPRGGVLLDVIKEGESRCEVEIVLDDAARTTLTRKRTASATTTLVGDGVVSQVEFDETVRALVGDQAAIRAAMRSGGLLDMDKKGLQQFLVDLTGARFDADGIAEALGEDVAAAAERLELKLPTDLDFVPFEKAAVQARRDAKRRHDERIADFDRAPAPAIDPGEDVTEADVTARIRALRAEREQAIRAEAACEASAASDRESLAESLRARVAELAHYADQEVLLPSRPVSVIDRELADARREAARLEALKSTLEARIAEGEGAAPAGEKPARSAEEAARELSSVRAELRRVEAEIARVEAEARAATAEAQRLVAKAKADADRVRSLADECLDDDEDVARDLHSREAAEARAEEEKDAAERRLRGAKDDHARCERRLADLPKGTRCLAACEHCEVENAARTRAAVEQELKVAGKRVEDCERSLRTATTAWEQASLLARSASEAADRVAAKADLDRAESLIASLTEKSKSDAEATAARLAELTAARDESQAREKALVAEVDAARDFEREAANHAVRAEHYAQAVQHLADLQDPAEVRQREAALVAEFDAAREVEREATQLKERQRELATAKSQLVDLEATTAPQPPPVSSEVLGQRLAKAEELLVDVRARDAHLRAAAAVDREAVNVRDANLVAKALGPGGAKATLIANECKPFLDAANAALETLNAPWRVAIDAEAFGVVAKRGDTLFRPEQLSDGHRMRLLFALQYAVARLARIGFITFDRVELLDEGGRDTLDELVARCGLEGIQVLLLRHGEPPATVPAGTLAYAVRGTVKRIPEHDAHGEDGLPPMAAGERAAVRTEALMA